MKARVFAQERIVGHWAARAKLRFSIGWRLGRFGIELILGTVVRYFVIRTRGLDRSARLALALAYLKV